MKYVIFLGDGMGDYPIPDLGGKTPLEVAEIPYLNSLARGGEVGCVKTAPEGFYPGSDVTNLGILGYDPRTYYTGRSPLEAASMGVSLSPEDVSFRCNLVTLSSRTEGYSLKHFSPEVVLEDYSAGHITSPEARELISAIDQSLGSEKVRFYPGVSYRHLMVWKNGTTQVRCTPPHDLTGRGIAGHLPEGDGGQFLESLMETSLTVLQGHPVNKERIRENKHPANSIWLWGEGRAPRLPSFRSMYGLSGAMISAVDLLRGIGVYAGFEIVSVPGATGYLDTNFKGKGEYALMALDEVDLVFVHVEAPDEAGHMGDFRAKISAIEKFDHLVVGTVVEGLSRFSDWAVMVLPDHLTPVSLKTHTSEPVPFLIHRKKGTQVSGLSYNESSAKKSRLFFSDGPSLLWYFVRGV